MGTEVGRDRPVTGSLLVPARVRPLPKARRSSRFDVSVLAAALIVVVGAIVAWLRLPESTSATLWAEDARNFLGNAVAQGPIAPLFRVYAGYLHTVPRIIAGLTVTFVPMTQWAHAMALGSCIVAAVVAATIFFCARVVTESWALRLALAAVTILAPLAAREVLGNTANLHWYFLWLAPWLILYRSRSRRGTIALTIVAALGALTEVQMLAFVPLMFLRWKSGARLPVRLALLGGGALQILAYISAPRAHSTAAANDMSSTIYGYLINAVMTIWNANGPTIGRALVHYGPAAAIVALVPIVIAAVWSLRFGTRDQRWLVVTFLAASVVLWVLAVKTNPHTYYEYSSYTTADLANPWLTRYGVVPSMELIAVMVIALGVRWPPAAEKALLDTARRRVPIARLVVGTVLLAFVLTSLVPASTRRSGGPEFAPQVIAAEHSCIGKAASAPVVLASPPAAGWKIYLDCGRLPGYASGHGLK